MISKVILKDHLQVRGEWAFVGATQDSPATPDVRAKAPEYRANQETDILLVGDQKKTRVMESEDRSRRNMWSKVVGTRLTEFEERWLKEKFFGNRVQNHADDSLLRVRLVRGWGIAYLHSTVCPQTIQNRRQRRAIAVDNEVVKFSVNRVEDVPDTCRRRFLEWQYLGASLWRDTRDREQELPPRRNRCRRWPHEPGRTSQTCSLQGET